jgi:hypothetical protein
LSAISDTKLLAAQVIEQRLSLFKIRSIETFGEPVVNLCEKLPSFIFLALLLSQAA